MSRADSTNVLRVWALRWRMVMQWIRFKHEASNGRSARGAFVEPRSKFVLCAGLITGVALSSVGCGDDSGSTTNPQGTAGVGGAAGTGVATGTGGAAAGTTGGAGRAPA